MSDTPTPRTDENIWASIHGCIKGQHVEPIEDCYVPALFARQLERELAAANKERDDALMMLGVYKLGCDEQKERIRRLTEAGNEMARQFHHPTMQTHQWNQAKEATP
jgi:hypothetical protein